MLAIRAEKQSFAKVFMRADGLGGLAHGHGGGFGSV
jgi:hypothetical protein